MGFLGRLFWVYELYWWVLVVCLVLFIVNKYFAVSFI